MHGGIVIFNRYEYAHIENKSKRRTTIINTDMYIKVKREKSNENVERTVEIYPQQTTPGAAQAPLFPVSIAAPPLLSMEPQV
jgi:hypothetical protein